MQVLATDDKTCEAHISVCVCLTSVNTDMEFDFQLI